jgi:hypothetical protein
VASASPIYQKREMQREEQDIDISLDDAEEEETFGLRSRRVTMTVPKDVGVTLDDEDIPALVSRQDGKLKKTVKVRRSDGICVHMRC